MNIFDKIKTWWRGLPDRKPYIEFVTALLTIPVLLTVILINLGNLSQDQDKQKNTNNTPVVVTISKDKEDEKNSTPTPTPVKECEPKIGDLSIAYPQEGSVIEDNPVQFAISYKKGNNCSVVWSYRINGGRWSDYDDKSISIFNLPNGNVVFELKVKSVVSGEEKVYNRNFIYQGSPTTPTPVNSPTPTTAAQ